MVIKIELYRTLYGGHFYEKHVFKVLSSKIKIRRINVIGVRRFKSVFSFLYYFILSKFLTNKVLILNLQTVPFFSFFAKKTVVIIHHVDWSGSRWHSKIYQQICFLLLSLFKTKWQKIVVVSKYWELFLKERGFKNISIIYNSFETNAYHSLGKSPSVFKTKYNLSNFPIIYLGNPQKGKGWEIVYHALKDLNFQFIVTGNTDGEFKPHERLIQLNLRYPEYLTLLKHSTCSILFSTFKEGWNRSAHESLLMGTPVIGSGKGGMQELLKKSGQEICTDITNLKNILHKVLINKEHYVQVGWKFSSQFNEKYFADRWLNLIRLLTCEGGIPKSEGGI